MRYPITSEFMNQEGFRTSPHLGIDFAMPKNTELRTIQDGIVEKVVNYPHSLGKAVYIKWEDGKTAIYGHMNDIIVKVGDKLKVGDLIGYSGNTGNVVGKNGGYHLHFGIKENGTFINPEKYVPLIQEMNHNLLTKAETLKGSERDIGSIIQTALDQYIEMLESIGLNFISLLHDIHITYLKFYTVLFW